MKATLRRLTFTNIILSTDDATGNKTPTAVNLVVCTGNLEEVGLRTKELAAAMNTVYTATLVVNRMFYNKQKFVYYDSELFEIKNIGRAKRDKDVLLPVAPFSNAAYKLAVETAIEDL